MGKNLKLLIIAGARPNFMKVAPILKAAAAWNGTNAANDSGAPPGFSTVLVHTGQHYDARMSGIFFNELGIPQPDVNLEVGSLSHAAQTANIMIRFEPVLLEQKPDWVLVVGDVNSTMACTLVCSKLGVRVAHVEAGLRSFDRTMPEEINRIVTDALADLLLTPAEDADHNLRKEGIPASKIVMVGNVMIDALTANLEQARRSPVLNKFGLQKKQFAYVTLHRPSNVDDRKNLGCIMAGLEKLARELPVIFPVHPRTGKMLAEFGLSRQPDGGIKFVEPIGYHDSLCLTENARLVLTDSGGLQEESTWFRTPCLTLRPNTERPVTVTLGSNRLTRPDILSEDIARVMNNGNTHGTIPPLWDGHTAERILRAIVEASNLGPVRNLTPQQA